MTHNSQRVPEMGPGSSTGHPPRREEGRVVPVIDGPPDEIVHLEYIEGARPRRDREKPRKGSRPRPGYQKLGRMTCRCIHVDVLRRRRSPSGTPFACMDDEASCRILKKRGAERRFFCVRATALKGEAGRARFKEAKGDRGKKQGDQGAYLLFEISTKLSESP